MKLSELKKGDPVVLEAIGMTKKTKVTKVGRVYIYTEINNREYKCHKETGYNQRGAGRRCHLYTPEMYEAKVLAYALASRKAKVISVIREADRWDSSRKTFPNFSLESLEQIAEIIKKEQGNDKTVNN